MACINKDYTTEVNAAVTLLYPSPVPRAPKTCETASGTAGAAGAVAYEESNYKTLPSNAPAKACVAECCAQEVLEAAAPKKLSNSLFCQPSRRMVGPLRQVGAPCPLSQHQDQLRRHIHSVEWTVI